MTGTATRHHTSRYEDVRSAPMVLVSHTGSSTPGWRAALGHTLGAAALMVTGLTAVGATTTVTGLVSFLRTN